MQTNSEKSAKANKNRYSFNGSTYFRCMKNLTITVFHENDGQ